MPFQLDAPTDEDLTDNEQMALVAFNQLAGEIKDLAAIIMAASDLIVKGIVIGSADKEEALTALDGLHSTMRAHIDAKYDEIVFYTTSTEGTA